MTGKEFIESIRLEGEEWADVPGWEGFYAVSSFGRVASIRTEFYYNGREKPRKVSPFIMNTQSNKTTNGGYKVLRAYYHRKYELFYVHILVAKNFVVNPDPKNFKEVDHIDGDTRNNNAANLRWTNRSGNMLNPITRRRQSESHKNQRNESQFKPVARIADSGETKIYNAMADVRVDGFSQSAVSLCCSGKRDTHRGFKWVHLSDYEKLQASISKNSQSIQDD